MPSYIYEKYIQFDATNLTLHDLHIKVNIISSVDMIRIGEKNSLKNKITELIEQTFNREGSLYLVYDKKHAFSLQNNHKDILDGHFNVFDTLQYRSDSYSSGPFCCCQLIDISIGLWGGVVFDPCFVVQYLVLFLIFHSPPWGRQNWLLCFNCLLMSFHC